MSPPADASPRIWRPMAAWTAGILLALGLIWFLAAVVVVPYLQARAMIRRLSAHAPRTIPWWDTAKGEVEKAGGHRPAARRLAAYLRMPAWLAPDRMGAAGILASCGSEATSPLVRLLQNGNPDERRESAWALSISEDSRAVAALITALRDSEPNVRSAAAVSLGWIRDKRALEPLIAALGDTDQRVRGGAAFGLKCLRDRNAVEPLTRALERTEQAGVRMSIAEALGEMADSRAVAPLIAAMEDECPDVRSYAALGLGKLGDARAVAALESALKDENPRVRSAAAEALKKIRGEETKQ